MRKEDFYFSIFCVICMIVIIIITLSLTSCSGYTGDLATPEPDTEIRVPRDHCDGDVLKEFTGDYSVSDNGVISYVYYKTNCPVGCRLDGEGLPYCKDPCQNIECPEPEIKKACETPSFLVEYKNICAETAEAPYYECIPVVGTRRFCGCYEATDEREAHCYDEN